MSKPPAPDHVEYDEMGVYVEPPSYVLGVSEHRDDYIWRTQPEGVRSRHGDTDLVLYGLRKFLRLAIKGNPTVLLPLYAPESDLVVRRPLGEELRAYRSWFLSAEAVERFLATCRPSTSGCWAAAGREVSRTGPS